MNITSTLKDSVYYYLYKKIGTSFPIRQINFAVTYKCNSRCLTCDIWNTYSKDKSLLKKELSVSDISAIFSQFKGLRSVGITGGEPFLRNDIVEIVNSIKSRSITLSTNGLLSQRIVKFTEEMLAMNHIKELGISISIDATGKLHDKIRGVPGSFKKCLATIKSLKQLQKRNKKLIIGISNTISKANIGNILKVYNLAKRLDVIFSTRLAQSSGLFYKNISSKVLINNKDTPHVKKIFQYLLKEQPKNIFYRYYLNRFLKNPNNQPTPCFSGFNSLFIDPYGNLYPCIMLERKIGNLKKKSLKQLLNSNEAKKIRKYITNEKCSCWTDCEALNSLYSNPIELAKAFLYFR